MKKPPLHANDVEVNNWPVKFLLCFLYCRASLESRSHLLFGLVPENPLHDLTAGVLWYGGYEYHTSLQMLETGKFTG